MVAQSREVSGLVALLAFLLAPMLVVVLIAFSSAPYLTFPPPGWSWRWVQAFLRDANWLEAAWFSLWVSLAAAATSLAVGTPFAFGLARGRFAGRRLLWLLAVSPMILPHIVIGLGLFFTFVAVGAPNTAYGALISKQVDANMTFEPSGALCEVLKTCRVLYRAALSEKPAELFAVNGAASNLVVTNETIEKNAAAVAN